MGFLERMRDILRQERVHADAKDDAGPECREVAAKTAPTTAALLPVPGSWIEWQSPLFTVMTGEVIDATGTEILVWHPKVQGLSHISVGWVTRTLSEPKRIVR